MPPGPSPFLLSITNLKRVISEFNEIAEVAADGSDNRYS